MSDRSSRIHRRTIAARQTGIAGVVTLLLGLIGPAAAAHPIDPNWTPPRTVYVPETGHTVDRLFLDLWRGGGGIWAFGNPITPEVEEVDGRILQYYEYARFEYWPEGDENGNIVALGNVGAELRPPLVPRRGRTGGDADGRDAAREAAQIARAWLPLDPGEVGPDTEQRRFVPATGHTVAAGFKAFWEATGAEAYLGHPLTEEYALAGVTYQVFERGQLAWAPGRDAWMVPVGELLAERYRLDTSPVPQGEIPTYSEDLFVPPILVPDPAAAPSPPAGAAQSIVVSLGQQALWAFEGGAVVLSTYVSTGKARFETPPGLFSVNSKIPVQDMAGVIGGEYYDVPQVPDVLYFTDRGHAIHGTYWHANFGVPMSHGCINLPLDVSAWMYQWAPVGTPVLIVP